MVYFVYVKEGLITLSRSKYMDRYFGCSFFTTFFLREKESGGKKSAYKGDCAAIRCAPIRRKIPLIYPPMTALPIAPLQDIVRNARQALCLAFLIERMHVYRLNYSCSHSVYTLNCHWDKRRNFPWLRERTSYIAVNSKNRSLLIVGSLLISVCPSI